MGTTNDNQNKKDPRMEITFCTAQKAPSAAIWEFTESELCEAFLKISREFIPDFMEFTIDNDPKSGSLAGFVWLEKSSKHLTDNSLLNNPKVALQTELPAASDDINKFTKIFCKSNERHPWGDQSNKNRCGFKVDLTVYIDILVDKKGEEYQRQYGYRPSQFDVEIIPHFRERGDRKYDRLDYIEIKKSLRRKKFGSAKPVPVRAYRGR